MQPVGHAAQKPPVCVLPAHLLKKSNMSFILHLKHSTHLSKNEPETVYLAVSGAGTVSAFMSFPS